MLKNARSLTIVALAAGSIAMQAQTAPSADERDADAAYTAHQWARAEAAYAVLTRQKPDSIRFWFRLGVCKREGKQYAAAIDALTRSRELGAASGLPGPPGDYELALSHAALGDSARALSLLKSAADGGYAQPDRLEVDAEWVPLRADERFLALVKQIRHNATPCEDVEFRQFDFWLGDWDVSSTNDGTPRGKSHISREMGGCVLWENWSSLASAYFGKSYNTYNVNLKRWEQYWVDNSAGTIFFHGGLVDGVMDYWTDDVPQPNGDKLRRHLQFFNLGPDKVRQFSQRSTDGGKTWNVEYDLTYSRHADRH